MKGLLIKDLYVVWKQARFMLIIIVIYLFIGAIGEGNSFWAAFSTLFISMLPVTVMGLDERSKWDKYAIMLPYSKKDMVLSKYILGIAGSAAIIILYGILRICVMVVMGKNFQPLPLVLELLPLIMAPCFFLGINLPVMFKMGVEKGRMWFILSMVVLMIGSTTIMNLLKETAPDETAQINSFIENLKLSGGIENMIRNSGVIVTVISILFLLASITLSIRIYEKKEI